MVKTSQQKQHHEESVEEKTLKELRKLNREMAKFNSRRQVFVRGIVRGLGAAIGATVVAAIVFAIISFSVRAVDDLPVFRDIIDGTNLEDSINN